MDQFVFSGEKQRSGQRMLTSVLAKTAMSFQQGRCPSILERVETAHPLAKRRLNVLA